MARRSKTSVSEAADCLDRMVHDLVRRLRQGKEARLPGVGTFHQAGGKVTFEREEGQRGG